MDSDLQYCIIKLSQTNPQTVKQVRNILDGRDNSTPDCLISQATAAKILGVSRTTFWRMLKIGMLPVVKLFNGIVRIRMSDVQSLIAQCKKNTTTEDEQ